MKKISLQNIAIQFVENIPEEYVCRVVDILQKEQAFEVARMLHRLQATIPQVDVQEKIRIFVEGWGSIEDPPSPREMGLIIASVDAALAYQRKKESIELTWTGPKTRSVNLRRTDQALLELIGSAQQKIIIVSFAVYKAKNILYALEQAATREVEIDIIVETPDASEGKITYDTIASLGASLKSKARIFVWPYSQRESTSDGKYGALHAKVAVGDGERLFISSANLTEYAMNLNMEMGTLIIGGDLPNKVQSHFNELIMAGILSEICFNE